MSNFFIAFLMTSIAGLSTLIGTFIIYFKTNKKDYYINICLIISSIIMLYISLFDLIPESFNYINKIYEVIPTIMLIIMYIIFGGLLIYSISSKTIKSNSLYKIGILSTIALVIHNIPEGIITFITTTKNIKLGLSMAVSIALHNIPEGMAIAIPVYYSTGSKKITFLYTILASISEPLGGLLSYLFINNINDFLFAIILSFTAGIMIYLSFEYINELIKRKRCQ